MPRVGRLCLLLATLPLGSCRSGPERPAPVVLAVTPAELEAGETFSTRLLFSSELVSAHATTLDGPLRPHLHREHEETVYVLRGLARMRIGDDWHELGPGDLVHVPRGVVHEVVTEGPAAVLSLFAPPFRGVDRVWVDETAPDADTRAEERSLARRTPRRRGAGAFVVPHALESRRDPSSGP